jgi:hypothetical protein
MVRYRFITSTPLNSDQSEMSLDLGGRKGTLKGDMGPLRNCNWLTIKFDGLEDEKAAQEFGA